MTEDPPHVVFSQEPGELARQLEKMARDYHTFFWSQYVLEAAKMLQFMLAEKGPITTHHLPSAELVAMHMRMSAGAVRMTYTGIQEVTKAGHKLPALAELEASRRAAEAKEIGPIRRRTPASQAVAAVSEPVPVLAPLKRRTPSKPAETAGKGFFS